MSTDENVPKRKGRGPKVPKDPEAERRKQLLKSARANKRRVMEKFQGLNEATNEQLLNMATYNITGDEGPRAVAP